MIRIKIKLSPSRSYISYSLREVIKVYSSINSWNLFSNSCVFEVNCPCVRNSHLSTLHCCFSFVDLSCRYLDWSLSWKCCCYRIFFSISPVVWCFSTHSNFYSTNKWNLSFNCYWDSNWESMFMREGISVTYFFWEVKWYWLIYLPFCVV